MSIATFGTVLIVIGVGLGIGLIVLIAIRLGPAKYGENRR